MEDADGPPKENWEFCVFQMKKKKYHVFKSGISDKLNIPISPDEETLIMCLNFRDNELKKLLVDKLKVSPIMYYECMLVSPIDKVFEFYNDSLFYNMVINRDDFQDSPIILRMIRKQSFAVIIMNQPDGDKFSFSAEIANRFDFKLIKKMKFPLLFKKRAQMKMKSAEVDLKAKARRNSDGDLNTQNDNMNKLSIAEENNNPKISRGEVGRVIIQRIKTIRPLNDEQVDIDYIMFWLSSEGLK